ncbi:putative DNA-binding domain-containing protein [Dongia sp.]|uniref:HvfC/BufC family peptide modification chaperone n=1 Tax=Dongia sp. TaxID=1977262 RepID=UPI0035B12F75
MIGLIDLQRQIVSAIREHTEMAPTGVYRPEHLPTGDSLSVYRNHHQISLGAVLAVTFRTVSLLIGEEAFHVLARRFLRNHPPRQPCVPEYGAEFPAYLDSEILVKDLPYLSDIARLDWALNRAAIAPDVASVDAALLTTLSPDQLADLSLEAHPSLTLLNSHFPLLNIYRLAHGASDADAIALDRVDARFVVWRYLGTIQKKPVSVNNFDALQTLIRGERVMCACENLPQSDLTTFFSDLVLAGGFILRA